MASYKFPVPKFNFEVIFPSGTISFQEVTGLSVENEFLEYRNGSDRFLTPERRAGMRKAGSVTFKKGIISGDTGVFDVYDDFVQRKNYYPTIGEHMNITVNLRDESNAVVRTWMIWWGVPTKISTDGLNSTDNSIAYEEIEISHSGIDLYN
ncbi:phage tail protein [Portibacter lacus]|uniref:Phage tail protein n=1 Tax=Portibacter lacus TaxID=1099794 RepID=A0AA37WCN3_9BACT|nr:phage tail protein [Portibacter lacus]GLR16706.1 hypothetical protein GCM10007940_13210 [Portibacter lacus]